MNTRARGGVCRGTIVRHATCPVKATSGAGPSARQARTTRTVGADEKRHLSVLSADERETGARRRMRDFAHLAPQLDLDAQSPRRLFQHFDESCAVDEKPFPPASVPFHVQGQDPSPARAIDQIDGFCPDGARPDRVPDPERIEHAQPIRADLQTGADLRNLGCPFQNGDDRAALPERDGNRQTADPSAEDRDFPTVKSHRIPQIVFDE